MFDAAAIILAGGRSSRMGSPKAELDWHGSSLLRRVTGLAKRTVDGPVVVVSARGQELPDLDNSVQVASDAREGRGPLQGLAAGMQAIDDRAAVTFVSSTDVPLLHPAFIRRVVGAFSPEIDVVLPEVGGFRQPLSAGYRLNLLPKVLALIDSEKLKPGFLFDQCKVLRLDEAAMLEDRWLSEGDPELASVSNLNDRSDYERALGLPAPKIRVQQLGMLAESGSPTEQEVAAWTLGQAAAAIGLGLEEHIVVALNGDQITRDPWLPLAAGDTVRFVVADADG